MVGSKVSQGHIGFVAHTAHHRNRESANRAHHALVVEGPQVFKRASPSAHDQQVNLSALGGLLHRLDQGLGRIGALHQTGVDDQRHMRGAARQCGAHIAQRGRAQRRDNTQSSRVRGQFTFAHRIKQTLGLQLGLELQEFFKQRALARALHRLGHKLQFTARLVHRQPAAHHHEGTLGGREIQQGRSTPEQRAAHGRRAGLAVLQGEVAVPAAGPREARDFPLDGDRSKAAGQGLGHSVHEPGNAPHRTPGSCGDLDVFIGVAGLNHWLSQHWRGLRSPQPRQMWLGGARHPSHHFHNRLSG